jgi:hypothetical protein
VAILLSAVLVVATRVIAPFEVGRDQSLQLEAAYRLVEGLGLTSSRYVDQPLDLTLAPQPRWLTSWPPGFSLLIAAPLWLGASLLVSLRVIYAAATLAGWGGWALLASQLLAGPVGGGSRGKLLLTYTAAFAPLFVTPVWHGTDLFLWAGVPWMVLLLTRGAAGRTPLRSPALAGLLVGFLCTIRYASLFLALAASLILLPISLPDWKLYLKRAATFWLSSLVFLVPLTLYLQGCTLHGARPPAMIDPAERDASDSAPFYRVLHLVHTPGLISLLSGTDLARTAVTKLDYTPLNRAVGTGSLVLIFLLPLIVSRRRSAVGSRAQHMLALSISLLPAALVLCLTAIALVATTNLLGEERYFQPLQLCTPLLFGYLMSRPDSPRPVRAAAGMLLVPFVLHVAAYMPAKALRPESRPDAIRTVLGYRWERDTSSAGSSPRARYPSHQVFSAKENSRAALVQLHARYPHALFLVDNYTPYVYDHFRDGGPAPGIELRPVPEPSSRFWDRAYTSRPMKLFWVLDRSPRYQPYIPDRMAALGASKPATIFLDQYEKTEIVMSDLPAGHRFAAPGKAATGPAMPSGAVRRGPS